MIKRTSVSPWKNQMMNPEIPQRELMINKLKDDLLIARGRQKQYYLMLNYYKELQEKTKQLEIKKIHEEAERKQKLQESIKSISQLKKQLENAKMQNKTQINDLKDQCDNEAELRRQLKIKNVNFINLRKQAGSKEAENQRLVEEKHRLINQEEFMRQEYDRFQQTLHHTQDQLNQINLRIITIKNNINNEKTKKVGLVEKLKNYQHLNNDMSQGNEKREEDLQYLDHEKIQRQSQLLKRTEDIIQLQHNIEKNKKQTQNKTQLLKNENEKFIQLNNRIKKIQKIQHDRVILKKDIDDECKDIQSGIVEQDRLNKQLKIDLEKCRNHLDNVFKQNVAIQQQIQHYNREDQAIIKKIQRRKILPTIDNMKEMRTSRAIKNSRLTGT